MKEASDTKRVDCPDRYLPPLRATSLPRSRSETDSLPSMLEAARRDSARRSSAAPRLGDPSARLLAKSTYDLEKRLNALKVCMQAPPTVGSETPTRRSSEPASGHVNLRPATPSRRLILCENSPSLLRQLPTSLLLPEPERSSSLPTTPASVSPRARLQRSQSASPSPLHAGPETNAERQKLPTSKSGPSSG